MLFVATVHVVDCVMGFPGVRDPNSIVFLFVWPVWVQSNEMLDWMVVVRVVPSCWVAGGSVRRMRVR